MQLDRTLRNFKFLWLYLLMPEHANVQYYVYLLCITVIVELYCVWSVSSNLAQMLKWIRVLIHSSDIIVDVEEVARVSTFFSKLPQIWRRCPYFNILRDVSLSPMLKKLRVFQHFCLQLSQILKTMDEFHQYSRNLTDAEEVARVSTFSPKFLKNKHESFCFSF